MKKIYLLLAACFLSHCSDSVQTTNPELGSCFILRENAVTGQVYKFADTAFSQDACIYVVKSWNADPYLTGDKPRFVCDCW